MPGAYDAQELNDRFKAISDRIRGLEAQVAALSEQAGIPYDRPSDGAAPDVIELAQAGKTMEAIARYRELTGAGLEEARTVVLGL